MSSQVADVVLAMKDQGAGGPAITIGGLRALRLVAQRVRDAGYEFTTLERYEPSDARPVLLWDYGSYAVFPSRRIGSDTPAVSWCLESPLVAHRAYHRLHRIAERSSRIFGYPGVKELLPENAPFEPVHWPNERRPVRESLPWHERRLLTMINSNKVAHGWRRDIDIRRPYQSLRRLAASALAQTYRLRDTWQVPELYTERLRAITHFGRTGDFDLYGTGWDRPVAGAGDTVADAVARSYRGTVADKDEILSRYRFALVVENTSFPGYISEKLFDCFFAGVIPVYLGAPDVHDYLPSEAFVDLSAFDSYEHLDACLRSFPRERARCALDTARTFTSSARFEPFTDTFFAGRIASAVLGVLAS